MAAYPREGIEYEVAPGRDHANGDEGQGSGPWVQGHGVAPAALGDVLGQHL